MKQPIYYKEAQKFLDECIKTRELVSLTVLLQDGTLRRYDGWMVISSHWKGGSHTLKSPTSKEIRKVRDILIFNINGHPIYL